MYQQNPPEAPTWEHRPVPVSVRLGVRVMYAGAAASVLGTAAYIVTWYFDAYVIVSRPSFVHGDSGLSITGSSVVAWLVGFAGLVVCCLWLCTAPDVSAWSQLGSDRRHGFACPPGVLALSSLAPPCRLDWPGARGQLPHRPHRGRPAVAAFLRPLLQG